MEFSLVENEAIVEMTQEKEGEDDQLKENDDDGRFSNQMQSLSNLQSFNDFYIPENSYLKEEAHGAVSIPNTFLAQCFFSLIFTSTITYKNFQIMKNQFLLIFKVIYPEDFFKKIYEKKYFTLFGMEKSSKELIGFAVIDIKLSEKKADILALGVVKEYQNKKIGSSLLKKVLEELMSMGVNDVFLIVQQTNENAIKLYNKFGFEVYKIIHDYYNFENERENQAFLMKKTLISKKFWVFGIFKKITDRFFPTKKLNTAD